MKKLEYKIDFMGLISVTNANPNGDPLNGGRPRIDSNGYGIITDVCLKRKLRDRLIENHTEIYVSPPMFDADTLDKRASAIPLVSKRKFINLACKKWFDVRAFGQVFSNYGRRGSIGVHGPVSIHPAFSVDPVEIEEYSITRCINSITKKGKAVDTLGFRSYIRYGLYVMKGSVCAGLAEKTGFSENDAIMLRNVIRNIFNNDGSSARPEGSMVLERLYWWNHHTFYGEYPSSLVFDTIRIQKNEGVITPSCFSDYTIFEEPLPGLSPRMFANVVPDILTERGSQ